MRFILLVLLFSTVDAHENNESLQKRYFECIMQRNELQSLTKNMNIKVQKTIIDDLQKQLLQKEAKVAKLRQTIVHYQNDTFESNNTSILPKTYHFKTRTYRINVAQAKIFNNDRTEHYATWDMNQSFTSNTLVGKYLKISGYFPKGRYESLEKNPLMVNMYDVRPHENW